MKPSYILYLLIFATLASGAFAGTTVYRQKLTSEQRQKIWTDSCSVSLHFAQERYGSKISFPSKRDRKAFIVETCNKMYMDQQNQIEKTSFSLEQNACMSVGEKRDLVNFGEDSILFMTGDCPRIADEISGR